MTQPAIWTHDIRTNQTSVVYPGPHPCGCDVLYTKVQHETHIPAYFREEIECVARQSKRDLEAHYHDCPGNL